MKDPFSWRAHSVWLLLGLRELILDLSETYGDICFYKRKD